MIMRVKWIIVFVTCAHGFLSTRLSTNRLLREKPRMSLDNFVCEKLSSITRNFDALTERMADPDVATDRKQLLGLARERSSIEPTVLSYQSWQMLEQERAELVAMEQATPEQDMREMVREELRDILGKQHTLEKEIMVLLLPRDPNDDRNVMLEIRSGAGGDEAGIWAGDLVNIYKKYAESQGWKVSTVSESVADMGGYKTCVLQVTGDYVYSKMKYEVRCACRVT